jgi:hypothetical protein
MQKCGFEEVRVPGWGRLPPLLRTASAATKTGTRVPSGGISGPSAVNSYNERITRFD